MSVGAILIIDDESSRTNGGTSFGQDEGERAEICAGNPVACWDVLGRSVLQHVINNLQDRGVSLITVIAGDELSPLVPALPTQSVEVSLFHRPASTGLVATRSLTEFANAGVETVLLLNMNAYIEFDLESLLRFHRARVQPVTPVYDGQGRLDCWVLDVARCAESGLECDGSPTLEQRSTPYFLSGYTNRLRDARDFRRLISDILLSRCSLRPDGVETKPGIWIGEGARIHRRARVVAPAYIGSRARIEGGAVITRCSSIARGSRVGYGTVVEDSSILPDTYLGACLDVSHAVVSGKKFLDLRRNVAVEIDDAELVDAVSRAARFSFAAVKAGRDFAFSLPWTARKFNHERQPVLVSSESNV